MIYIFIAGLSFLAGYFVHEFGGLLELFDFDERWVAKQHEIFKKIVNSFF